MDYLLMGSYLLDKKDQLQTKSKRVKHREKDHTFELIEDIKKIEATSKNIKKFALALSAVILVFNGFLYAFRGYMYFWMLLLAIIFSVSALIKPNILKYIYKAWTTIALIIAWIINTIILSIVFYVVVTPIALIARIAKKEFLEIKIDTKTKSYWHDIEKSNEDIAAYKGQF
jgi:hypothetical protein